MDDHFVISKIKEYLLEVKAKGWKAFWLDNNPGKSERNFLNQIKTD